MNTCDLNLLCLGCGKEIERNFLTSWGYHFWCWLNHKLDKDRKKSQLEYQQFFMESHKDLWE